VVTGPYFDLPPGDELAWRNRRTIAERTGWPAGAVDACEQIEAAHPTWDVGWRPANTIRGFEAPAGFYATYRGTWASARAYGADPATVTAAIEAVRSECPECHAAFPVPAGGDIPAHESGAGRCEISWAWRTVAPQSSRCPACNVEVDVPPGYDVPPHKIASGEDWCRARCSERTV
jgi:hypothetical protein